WRSGSLPISISQQPPSSTCSPARSGPPTNTRRLSKSPAPCPSASGSAQTNRTARPQRGHGGMGLATADSGIVQPTPHSHLAWIMRYATRRTTDVSARYETPGLYPNVVPPVTPSPLHVIAVSWLHSPPHDPTLPRREPGARRAGREGDDDARAVPPVAERGRARRQP